MPWQTYSAPWTPAEDERLAAAVKKHGAHNWRLVAADVIPRSASACRARFYDAVATIRPKTSTTAMRACLGPKCRGRAKFESTGPGNRLCEACTNIVDGIACDGPDDCALNDPVTLTLPDGGATVVGGSGSPFIAGPHHADPHAPKDRALLGRLAKVKYSPAVQRWRRDHADLERQAERV